MMKKVVLAVVVLFAGAAQAAEIKHRFLAKDESRAQLHYVDEFDAANDWTIDLVEGCRDIRLLPGNRLLVSYPDGYAEFDLGTRKQVHAVRRKEFTKTETVTRLPNGNTVLGMNREGIRFVEVDRDGKVVREAKFPQLKTLRLMRLSPEGHFLFGANVDHVIEANWDGEVLLDFRVPGAKHIYWVKKLDDGALYRVVTGYGRSIVDITPQGDIRRQLGGTDDYHFFSRPFELPNGHTVACNWTGHKPDDSRKAPQLFQFDPKGKVVWTWHDPERAGTIHGVIVLE